LKYLSWFIFLFSSAIYGSKSSIQLRAAYFYPTASVMKEVYHNGGFQPEIEGDIRVLENVRLFLNFSAFYKKGETQGLLTPTSIQIYPLSFGAKYDFFINNYSLFYLGFAPSISWAIVKDNSPFVCEKTKEVAGGLVGKLGFYFYLKKHVIVDIFTDYSYANFVTDPFLGVQTTSVDLGGLKVGMGIGGVF
jgi:hypothetical protein